jgi:hypothetical protein
MCQPPDHGPDRKRVLPENVQNFYCSYLSLDCVVITSIQKHISVNDVTMLRARLRGKSTDFSHTLRPDRLCGLPNFLVNG